MRTSLRRAAAVLGSALLAVLLGGALRAELAPESVVIYTARDARGAFEGRAPVAALELRFDPQRLSRLELVAAVEPGRFDSGNFIRDANARRAVFDTSEYPRITFEATGVDEQGMTLDEGSSLELTLRGRLSMHGITRQIRVPVAVTRQAGRLRATGHFTVKLTDYQMTRPSLFGVVVDDEVEVAFDIRAALSEVGAESAGN